MNLSRTVRVLPLLLMALLSLPLACHAQTQAAAGDADARRDTRIAALMQRYDGQVPGAK